MKAQELIDLLLPLVNQHGPDLDIRIGDQIEAGPYIHQEIGGAWTTRPDTNGKIHSVILCANDDDLWHDEMAEEGWPDDALAVLPLIWKPAR